MALPGPGPSQGRANDPYNNRPFPPMTAVSPAPDKGPALPRHHSHSPPSDFRNHGFIVIPISLLCLCLIRWSSPSYGPQLAGMQVEQRLYCQTARVSPSHGERIVLTRLRVFIVFALPTFAFNLSLLSPTHGLEPYTSSVYCLCPPRSGHRNPQSFLRSDAHIKGSHQKSFPRNAASESSPSPSSK